MKRKSTVAGLVAVLIYSLILRYPAGHEIGVDSYFVQAVASAISATGSMSWLAIPLSYLGLAPLSYSPAVPVSLSSFAQLGGVDLEPAIMAYSMFLGAVTCLTSFILGRTATHHDGASLFLALLITSAEGMVSFTDWTASARGTFLVFVPLAVALLLRATAQRAQWSPHRSSLVFVAGVMVLVHALWLMLIPALVAGGIASRISSTEDSILRRTLGLRSRSMVVLAASVITGLVLLTFLELGPTQTRILVGVPQFEGGVIPGNAITRIGLQYATVVGLGVILFPIGLYRLSKTSESRRRYLLMGLCLVFLPISLDPSYGILIAIPVILLVSAIALVPSRISKANRKARSPTPSVATALLVGALIVMVPPLVTIPRTSTITCQQNWTLDSQTYNAGLYLKSLHLGDSSFAWDDRVEASRIEAISGVPSVEPLESIGVLEYPWLRHNATFQFVYASDMINSMIEDHQLLSVREWLSTTGASYDYYWGKHTFVLLQSSPESPAARQVLGYYKAAYAIQRCETTQGVFFSGLHSSNYVAYLDERQRIFLI